MATNNAAMQIKDNTLLENILEGHIVTAKEWNSVMTTLKVVINNNAKVSQQTGNIYKEFYIYPANTGKELQWTKDPESQDDESLYYVRIEQDKHNIISDTFIVHTYDDAGNQVFTKVSVDNTNAIVMFSRINKKVRVTVVA
jgi:hypothetical protein